MKWFNHCKTWKSPLVFQPSDLLLFYQENFCQFANKVCKSLSDTLDNSECKHDLILSLCVDVLDTEDVGEFVSWNDCEMGHIGLYKFFWIII